MSSNNTAQNGIGSIKKYRKPIDGILGVYSAFLSLKDWSKSQFFSRAITRIQNAKTLPISGLHSLLQDPTSSNEELVIVRGVVSLEPCWRSCLIPVSLRTLHSYSSPGNYNCVALKTTSRIHIPNWLFGQVQGIQYLRDFIPFALVGPDKSYVLVSECDDEIHPIPFTTIYEAPSVRSFGLLEEKILPLGKEIAAVGTISHHRSYPQIHACPDLPVFLSDMNKDDMLQDLASARNYFICRAVFFGSISIALLVYALYGNWKSIGKSLWEMAFSWEGEDDPAPSQVINASTGDSTNENVAIVGDSNLNSSSSEDVQSRSTPYSPF